MKFWHGYCWKRKPDSPAAGFRGSKCPGGGEQGAKLNCLSLPFNAHRCLVGPDQESKELRQRQWITGFPELFPNVGGASSNLVFCAELVVGFSLDPFD